VVALVIASAGCATTASFSTVELAPLRRGEPVADDVIARAIAYAPNDATWLQLEQAFALLRHADGDDDVVRARSFLEPAFASFEDLRDPENLNVAFTADAETPYRGRPHERVLAATTLALTDAAKGRCDLALPTLKAAEFLDVRWQRLAFGTDATLVYALARWCLRETSGRSEDVMRAEAGIRLTLRSTAAADAARALVRQAALAVPRPDAVAAKLALELAELGVLSVLANDPTARTPDEILAAGLVATAVFGDRVDELLDTPEFAAALSAAMTTSGKGIGDDLTAARAFVTAHLKPAIDDLAAVALRATSCEEKLVEFRAAVAAADEATAAVLAQATQPRLALVFSGLGPQVVREGTYDEVARLVPREGSATTMTLRRAPATSPLDCGLRGHGDGGFSVVLCSAKDTGAVVDAAPPVAWEGLEVWSSSVQATTVVGRRFDTILKGRAAFKAGTETAAEVATWTAWTLWHVGFEMLEQCGSSRPAPEPPRRAAKSPPPKTSSSTDGSETCAAIAVSTIAAGAVVAGVGGVVWLAGAVNPAADPRFVATLPERVALLVPSLASSSSPPSSSPSEPSTSTSRSEEQP
jgi:hypothetical protein